MNYPQSTFDLQQQLSNLQSQLQNVGNPGLIGYGNPVPPVPYAAPQPQQIFRQVDHVDGLTGAKEYQDKLAPGSSVIVLDNNSDVFYFLTKDANGNAPKQITVGDFTLRKQETTEPAYVTRQDLEDFKAELKQLLTKEKDDEQLA